MYFVTTTVISVGTNGIRYQHPNEHVLEAVAQRKNINLMCTQVTERCEVNPQTKISNVKNDHETEAESKGCFQTHSSSGCPCSGTVIIELDKTVKILQPTPSFHHNLIKTHFSTPKCFRLPIT
jgi:competence protein ComEC